MSDEMTGGCACGRIRYTAQIDNDEAYLCHCRMCQRATGSVSIAFKNVTKADVDLGAASRTGMPPRRSRERPYCRECGTSLGFAHPDSEKMDLTVASFDDPSRFRPDQPFRRREHAPRLARHRRPAGTAHRRISALIDRWMKAVGKLPD